MKRWYFSSLILGLALSCSFLVYQQREVPTKPNIILFISDDQSWQHASAYGDEMVQTPHFDRVAAQGVLFENAYCSAPACAPSRASMLAGRNFWELGEGAIHFSFFPKQIEIVTDILADNGYAVGYTGKGWGPGLWEGYRKRNPSGQPFQAQRHDSVPPGINGIHYAANFVEFYRQKGEQQPFFFLLGATEPHRPLPKGMGLASGKKLSKVQVPPFLPDTEAVRSDLLDYYYAIEWFDRQVGEVLSFLEQAGELDNTLIVITSDNGMPFPRAKSNLYDYGARLPLVIAWAQHFKGGRRVSDFVSLPDLAPTFLECAGLPIPTDMSKKSLLPILSAQGEGRIDPARDHIIMGKELHAWCHPDGEINPVRAIRTDEYLYIQNLKPEMWPAGHPDPQYAWDLHPYGDVDQGPSKTAVLQGKDSEAGRLFFELAFGKRPAEELYYLPEDPYQLHNLAFKPGYQEIKRALQEQLHLYLENTGDPRTLGRPATFDQAPYFWSHGLATAGLPLPEWEKLPPEAQAAKVDSLSRRMNEE